MVRSAACDRDDDSLLGGASIVQFFLFRLDTYYVNCRSRPDFA